MKQNKYDDEKFFSKYQRMSRSVEGLDGAAEWPVLQALLPDVKNKHILDLGCGFGWHCRYMREQGASSVIGVDISEKMIKKADEMTNDSVIKYIQTPIEDISFQNEQFNVIFSSLALHYVESFETICKKVYGYLKPSGSFVFSVEHPIFTSREEQDWFYDSQGNSLHWPVDNYQCEGVRHTKFLTEDVIKYHRTISSYLSSLIDAGFIVTGVKEPKFTKEMGKNDPGLQDENRRPMFLVVSAEK